MLQFLALGFAWLCSLGSRGWLLWETLWVPTSSDPNERRRQVWIGESWAHAVPLLSDYACKAELARAQSVFCVQQCQQDLFCRPRDHDQRVLRSGWDTMRKRIVPPSPSDCPSSRSILSPFNVRIRSD